VEGEGLEMVVVGVMVGAMVDAREGVEVEQYCPDHCLGHHQVGLNLHHPPLQGFVLSGGHLLVGPVAVMGPLQVVVLEMG
jgi:hypothetical protein